MVRKSIFFCLSLIFYGYLLGNAPDSLDYLIVKIHDLETSPGSEDYGEDTKYFLSEQVYSLEENQWEITTYSYAKNSPNSATLNIFHDGGTTQTVWNLTFSSENSASGTWTEVEETVTYSGTTTFNIIDAGYAPEEIAGEAIIYTEGAESETATFSSDGKVYGDKEGEWTYYIYEKLSANAGKVVYTFENEQNPMPEQEILIFTAVGAGIFEWSEYSDATMSAKTDSGSGTFSMSDAPSESDQDNILILSDPNGQAVVVQLGEEYNWSDSLDGVTLWSVSGSESEGDWDALTAKFSGGKLIYGFEFADDVSDTGANTAPYEIDENGYIKSLEGDGDYQYYNVVSVEDGIIGTIQNDQGVESVADNGVNQVDQWFFTTRADAEEFYYSKVNPKSWMWFDHYPWVYSQEENDWLYFHPSGGSLMYWSNKGQAWRKFN